MKQVASSDKYKNKIITIPNILSFFRLCLLPVIALFYINNELLLAGITVLVSGVTDVVDGFIARTFNMISDVGKVLDPVADKLTQAVILILLATNFPLMLIPIALLIIKESFMLISGAVVVKKTGIVFGAEWHGKAATFLVTLTMVLHLFWPKITSAISTAVIILASAMILISLILYAVRNIKAIKKQL